MGANDAGYFKSSVEILQGVVQNNLLFTAKKDINCTIAMAKLTSVPLRTVCTLFIHKGYLTLYSVIPTQLEE